MDRFAFLVTAMSVAEAKTLLGFSTDSTPSLGDIKSAFRRKSLETHPDRPGGSVEAFQAVEAANAVLTGKLRPSYDRRDTSPSSYSPPRSQPRPKYEPPPVERVTFQEALGKAGVPGSVEWKFVTSLQKGTGWMGDSSSQSDRYYVAYGRTESKHVFLGMNHFEKSSSYVGGGFQQDKWVLQSYEYAIKGDEGTSPAWLHRNVANALKRLNFDGKFNSKVIALPESWKPSDKSLRNVSGSPKVSIKHWLVNSGEVKEDDAKVKNRKQVIEAAVKTSMSPKPGFVAIRGAAFADFVKITFIINGMEYVLNEKDTEKFWRMRIGGKTFKSFLWKDDLWDKKTVVTRLRDKKRVSIMLGWMAENMTLPERAKSALKVAAEQMTPNK